MSTLAPLRSELLGKRLLAGAAPIEVSAEDAIARAVNAAMGVVAAGLADAADGVVVHAERHATDRVAAADARAARATASEATTALEREWAMGQIAALERLERDLTAALAREQTLRAGVSSTTAALATERNAHGRARAAAHALGETAERERRGA